MDLPSAIYAYCDVCGDTTLHFVLKGRMGKKGMDLKVKCSSCENVREHKERGCFADVKFIISDEGESRVENVRMDRRESIKRGDIIQTPEYPVLVTSIESGEKRLRKAYPSEEITVWSKRYDVISVNFSINMGSVSRSIKKEYAPDDEICIGDEIILNRRKYIIHRIKTERNVMREGCVPARYIRRVYAKEAR